MRLQRLDNIDSEDANVEIYRFGRIIFEMNCSPFLLNATLKQHVPNIMPKRQILQMLY